MDLTDLTTIKITNTMKKYLYLFFMALFASTTVFLTSCSTVGTLPTEKLQSMYIKRIEKTSIFNKMFFNDAKKKKLVY